MAAGGKIAYSSHNGQNWEIYVMNADGSSPRRIMGAKGIS